MIDDKIKMRIRTAVADYFKMFPEDWEECKTEIQIQKQNLDTEFAELKGTHAITRALYTIPEKLSVMIAKKLSVDEAQEMSVKENARWFATEFPMFRITKDI